MKKAKIIFLLIILHFFSFSLFSQTLLSFEKLDGEWDFYLQKTPSQVFEGNQKDSTIYVPSSWNKEIEKLLSYPNPKTYACFTYTKKDLQPQKKYSILIKSAPATSCAVYVNGELLAQNGDPFAKPLDSTVKKNKSVSKPIYCEFYCNQNNQADILVFTSNYFYRKGGIWDSVIFGETQNLRKLNIAILFFLTFLVGVFLFSVLINFIQFILDRNNKTFFYLSILSVSCILRIMTSEYCSLGFLFPNLNAELKYKLEYIIMWIAPIAVLKNICFLYPVKTEYIIFKQFKELYLRKTFILFGLVFGTISLIIPAEYANELVPVFQIYDIASAAYILTIIAVNAFRRKRYIGFYLLSCAVLFIGAIADIIYTQKLFISTTFILFPFFLMFFITIHILLLVTIQNDVYKDTQKTYVKLKKLNESYLKFIPREFLNLLKKDSITKIKAGDFSTIEMCIVFAKFNIEENKKFYLDFYFNIFNECLKATLPIITKHEGFISKFLNGGIIALFPNDETNALLASIEMKKIVEQINNMQTECQVSLSIGLHYGKMILGTIGDSNRLDDTVISDTVNTASRIESVCKEFNQNIIISKSLYERLNFTKLQDFYVEQLQEIVVKGKKAPLQLYACKNIGE